MTSIQQASICGAIYQIKNLQNGRVYVGSSVNFKKRGWVAPEETRQKLSVALTGNTMGGGRSA